MTERYDTREGRIEHEDEVDAIISEWTLQHDKYEAMRLVGAAGIPAGAVRDTLDSILVGGAFCARQRCS